MRPGLERLSLYVGVKTLYTSNGHKPVTEFIGEEVTLAPTIALYVRIVAERLQAAAGTIQTLPAAHGSNCMLK